jgi:putative ABC transport system substrate-binding protein
LGAKVRRLFVVLLGALSLWAGAGQAQPAPPVIGFMSGRAPGDSAHMVAAFQQGLADAGFVEGKNIAVEYRWALGQYDRLPALAADLVQRNVALITAVGGDPSGIAAKRATSTIPLVFGMGGDPVKAGLVDSLSRPGGKVTGFTLLSNELEPKRLALEKAAQTTSQQLSIVKATNDTELAAGLASIEQMHASALLVAADPFFDTRRELIIKFAAQNKLPAIYQFREFAVAGGLISYGPNVTDSYRQAGNYVGQILKGAKPADLPVLQPTKFELVINLKTAKTLGLAVPPGLISFADEVIE